MQVPPLPPTLRAVIAEALAERQPVGLDVIKAAAERDPASLRAFAYRDEAKLKVALDEFEALPVDTPHLTKIAAVLAKVCVASSLGDVGHENLLRAAALAEIAEPDPDVPQDWRAFFAMLRGVRTAKAQQAGSTTANPRAAAADFDADRKFADAVPESVRREVSTSFDAIRQVFAGRVAYLETDLGRESELLRHAEKMRDSAVPGSTSRVRLEIGVLLRKMVTAARRGDHSELLRLVESARSLSQGLPASDPLRQEWEAKASNYLLYLKLAAGAGDGTGPWASASEADRAELQRLCEAPGLTDAERANNMVALALIRMRELTPASMDEAVDLCERALTMSPSGGLLHPRNLAAAGIVRLVRWQMIGDPGDRAELAAGVANLEQARDNAFETGNVDVLIGVGTPLSQAYLIAGRPDAARETAMTGLRGHVWRVLLQPRAADAHVVIRDAAQDAYFAVSLFLKSDRPDLAAWSLEMGRGLIIHAATEFRDTAARLEERGVSQLAREWRDATATTPIDQVPSELRRRVMSELVGVELSADGSLSADFETAMRLVPDPPSAEEIRAALLALDMDALVYLVPGEGVGYGVAAVIPVSSHPHWMKLAKLKTERAAGFEEYLSAAARDLSADTGVHTDAGTLDAMCEWAWDAAIGPVLADVDTPADRPVRVVLIPVRELSRIPWHGARRMSDDGRVRYAVEDAVFSYAASARMFCAAAWSGDVELTDSGLIVSDPDTAGAAAPLPGARVEAAAIRDRFYPNARFVGREADGSEATDGRGRAADVQSWLSDPQDGTLLHLACHATVRVGTGEEDTSYLLLSGGERLSAEQLVDALGASSGRDLAVAVLAACRSSESGRGYDEAFSLATALLMHNTRSVISARWNVPDVETSVLMYMFHYFLREDGLRPVDALRAAQLWMIRDDELPEGTDVGLRALHANRPPADVRVWAAFVHAGR